MVVRLQGRRDRGQGGGEVRGRLLGRNRCMPAMSHLRSNYVRAWLVHHVTTSAAATSARRAVMAASRQAFSMSAPE